MGLRDADLPVVLQYRAPQFLSKAALDLAQRQADATGDFPGR